jgi:REP element-mobilizing transposase RayT
LIFAYIKLMGVGTMGRRQVQLGLALPVVVLKHGWGGTRKGAGRKKLSNCQAHQRREAFSKRMPVHVTMKMAKDVKGLRGRRMYKAVAAALWAAARNDDGLLCDFSVQNDHLHLVMDAANSKAMRSAVSGLAIRVAKAINGLCGRKGRVFDDRYHARVLRTPTEVRRVRHYVRDNFRKHLRERLQTERRQDKAAWISAGVDNREVLTAILQSRVWIDPCSSQAVRADGGTWPVGRCWLLSSEADTRGARRVARMR